MKNEFQWVVRYRPKTIADCVLPEKVKQQFQKMVDSGDIQHLLLYSSTPGSGKTSTAMALCEELGYDYIIINGSNEGRFLETVRNVVEPFANTVSMNGGKPKVVIYDELDNARDDVMKQLRGVIEATESNCRYIATCNYRSKILPALVSRFAEYDFNVGPNDMPAVASQFMKRMDTILCENEIKFEKPVLAQFIQKHFPDYRKILNEIQNYSRNNDAMDEGILISATTRVGEFVDVLMKKDFKSCREWIGKNTPDATFYSALMNALYGRLKGQAIAQAILICADYQYKHSFCADSELNMAACVVELMSEVT